MGTGVKKYRRASGSTERNSSIQQTTTTFIARKGLLPPPDEMEKYEQLVPGITDRLLTTYEKQVDHRMGLENKVIASDIKKSYTGQILAFIICLLTIAGGIFLSAIGKDIVGLAAIFIPLAALITAFLKTSKIRREELKNKRQQ